MANGILETLFRAATEASTPRSESERRAAMHRLGAARQRAVACGIDGKQIQTIELAAKRGAALRSKFGRERKRG